MALLLTGGAGYIGSHTAVQMMNCGYEVIIADNFSNSSPLVIESIGKLCSARPKCYTCDVSSPSELEKVFAGNRIDGVLHFAGLKSVGESVRVPLKYYRTNIDCTLTLLECMDKYGVKNLIFSSSATVYGSKNSIPYNEDMDTGCCSNPYGWTKLMIERIIKDHAAADSDFSAVILRYFNPVGAHPSGLIGEAPNGTPNNLMPCVCRAADTRTPLEIYGRDYPTPDGTCIRDYIHIMDLANGHTAAADYCRCHTGVQEINLGTGCGYSVLDVVRTFSRVNGVSVPYVFAPRRDGDIAAFFACSSKAKQLLGWSAQFGIEEMCRDAWNWQKKQKII